MPEPTPRVTRGRHRRAWLFAAAVALVVAGMGTVVVRGEPAEDRGAAEPDTTAAPAKTSVPSSPTSDATGGPGDTGSAGAGNASPGVPSGSGSGTGPGALDRAPYAEATPEPAIGLRATADFENGLTIRITAIEKVRGEARGPGEIDGPALRLRVRAHNDGTKAVDLETVMLTLTYGRSRTPAPELHHPGGRALAGRLPSDGTRDGTYLFSVPPEQRDRIRVTASHVGGAPVRVLAGDAS